MLKGLFQHFTKDEPHQKRKIEPIIIPRTEHNISRQAIRPNALKVLYRLHNEGFSAYLVGGCVRDLLLGRAPKDFDIATNARPEEIRRLFKNSRLIGKRFRLAHIVFGKEIIEVATFRTHHHQAEEEHDARMHKGMIVRDNVFGPIEDDAERRDFSINALYYNIADFSVVDYANGMSDIKARLLRIIGNPELRYREDPVRLLRAARFMGKLKLNISPETEAPITHLSYLLQQVSSARLFQEVLKIFEGGALIDTFHLLQKYKLFEQLFPQTAALLHQNETIKLLEVALTNTDTRLQTDKPISSSFLFAVILWRPVQEQALREEAEGFPPYVAVERAIHIVLKKQTEQLAIPRRMQITIRDICFLQHRFTQRHGSRPLRALEHPRFRAGYDLLVLRQQAGEHVQELYDWWTQFQVGNREEQERLIKEASNSRLSRKRRKPRKFKNSHKKKIPTDATNQKTQDKF